MHLSIGDNTEMDSDRHSLCKEGDEMVWDELFTRIIWNVL